MIKLGVVHLPRFPFEASNGKHGDFAGPSW